MSRKLDSVFKANLKSQYVLQFAKYILPLVVMVLLTRYLGPESYGFRAYVLSVMTILQMIVDFGYRTSATKSVVEEGKTVDSLSSIVSEVFVGKIALYLVGFVVLIVLVVCIPMLQQDILFVLISYIVVFFNAFIPDFVFMGKEDMRILTVRYVVSKSMYVILLLICLQFSTSLLVVVILDLLTSVLAYWWTWSALSSKYGSHLVRVGLIDVYQSLKRSALYFLSIAATSAFTSFTTVLIGVGIEDPVQVAWWSIATMVISAVQSLFNPINNVLYPRVISSRDPSIIWKFVRLGTPIVIVGTVGVALLSPLIFNILAGKEFVAGSGVLSVLSLLIFFGFYATIFGWPVLGALGQVGKLTWITGFASCFHIIVLLALLLTGLFSIYLVAIVRCATEIVLCALRLFFSLRLMKSVKAEKGKLYL